MPDYTGKSKIREPFRNIPADGIAPRAEIKRSLNHTRKDEQSSVLRSRGRGFYHWKAWFNNIQPGDRLRIKIQGHHEFCRLNPEFDGWNGTAKVWLVDLDSKTITLTVKKYIGVIQGDAHIIVSFNPEHRFYIDYNGVFIKGRA
jgi:hypothetical protein